MCFAPLPVRSRRHGDGAATPVASEGDDCFFIALSSRRTRRLPMPCEGFAERDPQGCGECCLGPFLTVHPRHLCNPADPPVPFVLHHGGVVIRVASRLNHRLPWRQTHAKVMQGPADFHDQVADACLPKPAGVVDNPAALDAAIDVLDADAATCDAPIRSFLAAGEGSASWLAGRHDDLHLVERERLEAQILESSTPRRSGRGGGIRHPLLVGTPLRGFTQEEKRQHGVDQQHMFDRVALFLAAIAKKIRVRPEWH